MKVHSIIHGRLIDERVFKDEYDAIKWEYSDEEKQLPEFKDLKEFYQHPDMVRVLNRDFWCQIETSAERIEVRLKRGFMNDYGSIPKWARSVIPHDGIKYIVAFLVHDAFFGGNYGFTFSNSLLYEMLKEMGVPWRKRQYVHKAVQWFGKSAYKKPDSRVKEERKWFEIIRTPHEPVNI
jgi:hypothetical protein